MFYGVIFQTYKLKRMYGRRPRRAKSPRGPQRKSQSQEQHAARLWHSINGTRHCSARELTLPGEKIITVGIAIEVGIAIVVNAVSGLPLRQVVASHCGTEIEIGGDRVCICNEPEIVDLKQSSTVGVRGDRESGRCRVTLESKLGHRLARSDTILTNKRIQRCHISMRVGAHWCHRIEELAAIGRSCCHLIY